MPIAQELTINTAATAEDMAQAIFGDGMTVVAATYSGDAASSGIYSGASSTIPNISPTDGGVILSTGQAADFTNDSGTTDTNTAAGTGTDMAGGIDGDTDLDAVAGQATFDGSILEAEFIPVGDTLTMQFVFSSEEYLEYVSSGVNDAMGIWVNDVKIDLSITTGDVTIDTVNTTSNANLYLNNAATDDTYNTEMDGLTVVLSVKAPLNAGVSNTIKIGIADGGDGVYDSNLLIAADSVQSVALAIEDTFSVPQNSTAIIEPLANDTDLAGTGLTITQINGNDVVAGDTITLPTGEQVTLNADNTFSILTDGDIGSNAFTYSIVDGNGTTDVGYINIETTGAPVPDGYVDGSVGDDTIDASYLGDPNGDVVDGGDRILPGVTADDDVIRAWGGNDDVNAGLGNDSVEGGSGNDTVQGMAGNDTLVGGTGDDVLFGWEDNDSLLGGSGADSLDGDGGNDYLDGGADNDTLIGDAGNDTLLGGAGDDEIYDSTGADSIDGGAGNDTAFGGFGSDTLIGGEGADSLFGDEDNDTLDGGAGNDTLQGGDGADSLDGGDDDDSLIGGSGNDTIIGGAGDDFLRGTFGNDSLIGGEGDDYLWLGFGDDTVVLENDFGNDTIEGEEAQESTGDVMDLSAITDDLTIDLTNANPEAGTLTDGVSTAEFVEIENIILSSGIDTLVLDDFSGDDIVQSFTGPIDNGDGTFTGVDQLDVSNVTTDFGVTPITARDVTVTDDGSGNALLSFPAGGSLTLVGIDPVAASNLAYLVAMGIPSNEIVDGTAGDDAMGVTFVDEEGDQTDGTDGLADTIFGYAGDDTIDGGAAGDTIDGGTDDDSIDGQAGADSILGGQGSDTLAGGSEADTLEGGQGNDSLLGGADDDTLLGGLGDDTFRLDGGADTAEGNDGDDTFELTDATGNATIVGGEDGEVSGDTLDLSDVTEDLTLDLTAAFPENGSVTDGTSTTQFSEIENIILGGGTDTILLADGSGTDTVSAFETPTDNGDGTFTGNDLLDVTNLHSDLAGTVPVTTADVTIVDDNGNAQLVFPNGEAITLVGIPPALADNPAWLVSIGIPSDGIVSGYGADDVIDGAYVGDLDGDLVDSADGLDDTIEAGGGNDSVLAGAGDDLVRGEDGDDTLSGGTGTNTLIGGAGDDVFEGGSGADSFVGDAGQDNVDYSASTGAVNIDLADSIVSGGDAANDTLGFSIDGVTGSGFDDTLTGFDAFDATFTNEIDGGAGDDSIDGRGGDDSLQGGTGDDTIVLGEGNDTAFGGADADVFLLDSDADGNDVNVIDGGSTGIDSDTLDFSNVTGAGVEIDLTSTEDGEATWAGNTATFTDIESIGATAQDDTLQGGTLSDGIAYDAGAGDDIINSGDGADTLVGGLGNDTINTEEGADDIDAGAGDDLVFADEDDDTVLGGAGTDTLDGGTGNDSLDGGADADSLIGGAGADTLLGGSGDDTLEGGADADSLVGGVGADTLSGGAGNDTLEGGDGADVFTNLNAGDVVLGGSGGTDDDTLFLAGSASPGGSFTIVQETADSDGNGWDGRVDYFDNTGTFTGSLTFENIENFVPCFTPGTRIKTPMGEVAVEHLGVGDTVLTRDNGFQTIRWVGARTLTRKDMAANPKLRPVRIAQGQLGPNMPERDMLVSPQHRMLVGSTKTELWFGEEEMLVAAINMTCLDAVEQVDADEVTYIHILFDQHEIVMSDGTWSESFQPGDLSLGALDQAQRDELITLFPELACVAAERVFPAARATLKAHEARVFFLG
ncbi:Hint domain-containing protein [Primorskyibacter sp. S187A]|uniref:Hint domain-containing protein n=1 Tax=Primorskyibacter sp. S187A TaxID=3415130 RepID=UPI003C7E9097